MQIALAVTPTLQAEIFSSGSIDELTELGELRASDQEQPGPDHLVELSREARVLISSWGTPRVTAEVLAECPQLEVVLHAAGSVKPVVSDALWDRKIRVSSGSGALGVGVAESALGMTIASLKNHWRLSSDARNGGWSAERSRVRELFEVTVGVISAGHAGRHFIRLLQQFDVEVLLYDPGLTSAAAAELGAVKVDLDELIVRSDVVSVHAPSIPATDNMINAERLAAMKDDAVLINTARGSVIDEEALIKELSGGRLFACLDVTAPEPPAVDSPLRTLPNCVLTGHVAGAVTNGKRRIGKHVVAEIRRYLAGEPLAGEVTESMMSRIA